MKCHIDGCNRDARYKGKALCQMHYFRFRRNGHVKPKKPRRYRFSNARGYQYIFEPFHPLAHKNGYVPEHRFVLYAKLDGEIKPCEICGIELTWTSCCVDHIDNDRTNNSPDNLRPACMNCNAERGFTPPSTWSRTTTLTHDGITLTPTEWARDPRIKVCAATIRRRKQMGDSDYVALFGAKLTHNGKTPARPKRPPAYTRKNAVRLTIDGLTKTAAEWARHPECEVSRAAIVYRIRQGWSHKVCVFAPYRGSEKRLQSAEI